MSVDNNVRRRPDLWSYISFSRPSSRQDFTLPSHSSESDPFEKPDRRRSASESYPSSMSHGQKIRYMKYGGVFAFIVLVLYMLSPGQYISGRYGQTASAPGAVSSKCTQSYDPSKPLTQYALMIDAGSTGSRIHAYKFNNCKATPELESELFEQTAKKEGKGSGLSSYDSDAQGAAQSLDVLMEKAISHIPKEYRSCSPIAVKATAGLRKLGQEKSARILEAVRTRLEKQYPFPVIDAEKGGVEVMDGTDEGVYGWITINYLLGKIGGVDKSPTAAVFDLGGGSTQIVYEPTFPNSPQGGMPETMEEGDHKYNLTFGGSEFSLYQHSYLGYGLMAARENLHKEVVRNALANAADKVSDPAAWLRQNSVVNPCIGPGMSKTVEVGLDSSATSGGSKIEVNMTGPSSGSFAQCRAVAEKTLNKEAECKVAPCSFGGQYQPSLEKTFARNEIYLISYFYDRAAALGMPSGFTIQELARLSEKVCEGESGWADFASVDGALDELRDRPEFCLDLSFMIALLLEGYGMKPERYVRIAKKIGDNELGWCLGASLPLLNQESGWTCKINEVS